MDNNYILAFKLLRHRQCNVSPAAPEVVDILAAYDRSKVKYMPSVTDYIKYRFLGFPFTTSLTVSPSASAAMVSRVLLSKVT